jgi:hypothetical protein
LVFFRFHSSSFAALKRFWQFAVRPAAWLAQLIDLPKLDLRDKMKRPPRPTAAGRVADG